MIAELNNHQKGNWYAYLIAAREKGAHTDQEWRALKHWCRQRCVRCLQRTWPRSVLTKDHIVPISAGGDDSIANLQPLCSRCNSKKGTKQFDYRQQIKGRPLLLFYCSIL